jgi:hypothetical protein
VHDGYADSLIEASIRYVIAHPAVSTVLVGYSTMEHLEYAARSVEKGRCRRPRSPHCRNPARDPARLCRRAVKSHIINASSGSRTDLT